MTTQNVTNANNITTTTRNIMLASDLFNFKCVSLVYLSIYLPFVLDTQKNVKRALGFPVDRIC